MEKQILIGVYNALMTVETKGQSSIIMADCLKNLANVIGAMEQPAEKTEEEEK